MKNKYNLILSFLDLFSVSCATTKDTRNNDLFDKTWELEYISGTRIAFDGLYPDKKPVITFNKSTGMITGNNSCNGYSANFTVKGDSIATGEPGPATLMYCGEGEPQFLKMMKKIKTFSIDQEGKLNLKFGEVPMMRFRKIID